LDELKNAIGALDAGKRAEIVETIGMLTGNLEKIVEHGRRADGIVRSMLQHSRGGSGEWQATDLNALVEEVLNLAYHGARSQDQSFEITLERDLDRDLALVDLVPQEMTRVLLNLIGNGFYAANKRNREEDGTFRAALKVTTREFGESVEVRVRDTGVGIPPENRDKLFSAFLHDQADRRGHWAWAVDQLRYCNATARRHHHGRQRSRRVHRVHGAAATTRTSVDGMSCMGRLPGCPTTRSTSPISAASPSLLALD